MKSLAALFVVTAVLATSSPALHATPSRSDTTEIALASSESKPIGPGGVSGQAWHQREGGAVMGAQKDLAAEPFTCADCQDTGCQLSPATIYDAEDDVVPFYTDGEPTAGTLSLTEDPHHGWSATSTAQSGQSVSAACSACIPPDPEEF
jgi:hypothetical protein